MPDPTERYIPPGQFTRLWEQALPELEALPPKPVAAPPPPTPSPIETVLSAVQRPQQAVFALAGGEGLEGAKQALLGGTSFPGIGPVPERPPISGSELIGRWRGDQPGEPGGLGRDVAGLGLDILADPLNLIPFGKVASLTKAKGLVKAATAGAPDVLTAIPPVGQAAARQALNPTAVGRAVQRATDIPVVGGAVDLLARRFAPSIAEKDPVVLQGMAYANTIPSIQSAANASMAQLGKLAPWQTIKKDHWIDLMDGSTATVEDAMAWPAIRAQA